LQWKAWKKSKHQGKAAAVSLTAHIRRGDGETHNKKISSFFFLQRGDRRGGVERNLGDDVAGNAEVGLAVLAAVDVAVQVHQEQPPHRRLRLLSHLPQLHSTPLQSNPSRLLGNSSCGRVEGHSCPDRRGRLPRIGDWGAEKFTGSGSCLLPVVCVCVCVCARSGGMVYGVMVSVRSNQQQQARVGKRVRRDGCGAWRGRWPGGGGGLRMGAGGGSMIRASAWDGGTVGGRGRRSNSDPATRHASAGIVYARSCFVRRIRRVSAASLHSSRAPFFGKFTPSCLFLTLVTGQRPYEKEKYEE